MATKLISRTIESLEAKTVVFNMRDMKTSEALFKVDSDDTEKALKQIRKERETDYKKIVAVTGFIRTASLFVMTEEEFIRYAKPVKDMAEARAIFKTVRNGECEDAGTVEEVTIE